jgi:hypothetical protein
MGTDTLKKLFDTRTKVYNSQTKALLTHIINALEAIIEFMDLGNEANTGLLKWESIELTDSKQYSEGVVYLVGKVLYKVGERIEDVNGKIHQVNEENQQKYSRIIRVGLPFSLAAEGTKEEVKEFLYDIAEMQGGDVEEFESNIKDSEKLLNEIEKLAYSANNDYVDFRYQEYDDFDLDNLTDKQKENFELFIKSQGLKQ